MALIVKLTSAAGGLSGEADNQHGQQGNGLPVKDNVY